VRSSTVGRRCWLGIVALILVDPIQNDAAATPNVVDVEIGPRPLGG